jgi:hypothetical protein
MARIDAYRSLHLPLHDFPLSPETASPAELAEALIQITVRHPSEFDATLRASAKQLGRIELAEAQAVHWKQLQAGIAALFNGVKP